MRPVIDSAIASAAMRTAVVRAGAEFTEVVPVLPSTLLGLDLLAQRPAFDLRAAARLIRHDAGAVLQLFGALAHEFPEQADRPLRLEECLASAPRDRLFAALMSARGTRSQHMNLAALREHGVAVARSAEAVAGALGLYGEPAWLLGLLHELGCFPGRLGWTTWPTDPVVCCDRLASAYGLPATVRQALDEVHREQLGSAWTAVIAAAHDLLPRNREDARD